MKKFTKQVLRTLKVIEQNGVEGISLTELIVFLNLKKFIGQCRNNNKLLNVYNLCTIIKRSQGEISTLFQQQVTESIKYLYDKNYIFVDSENYSIFVRK